MTVKLLILKYVQLFSFKRASGLIFLNNYAHNKIIKIKRLKLGIAIIPHGVSGHFLNVGEKRVQKTVFSTENPCRIVYLSIVSPYKHQAEVVKAVSLLRNEGFPVVLDLYGPPSESISNLNKVISLYDKNSNFINYHGSIDFADIANVYEKSDIGVFASSCENMPNILLEGMASGLPFACSNMGPMPEILRDGGLYFDPNSVNSIASALKGLIDNPDLLLKYSSRSFELANEYSWSDCADQTFNFLSSTARANNV